ncbi:MAG: beta-galactosidase, partial [Fusobacteriaceae bacterium]
MKKYSENYLYEPEIFQVNRMEAHSDHKYFENYELATKHPNEQMNFRKNLNGMWRFSYVKNLEFRNKEFFKKDYDSQNWDLIKVPAHIQMEGYDKPHYTNVAYPWDGHENIIPPNLPKDFNPVAS